MEPAAVLLNRRIIGDGNIGASRRYPRGQQPQVIAELASKWRRGVVVRPMRQCQVMLRIEKKDVNHSLMASLNGDVDAGFHAGGRVLDGKGHYTRRFSCLADDYQLAVEEAHLGLSEGLQ